MASLSEEEVNVTTQEAQQPIFPSPRFKDALKKTRQIIPAPPRTKRIRPWDYCDNIEELKRMLSEKDAELTEKNIALADLQQKLKSAKTDTAATPAIGSSKALTQKQLGTQVNKLRRSIQSQVLNQMSYKPSTKHGTAKLVPVEIFDVDEFVLKTLFGETLMQEAASGSKQLKVVANNEEVDGIFGRSLSKTLRFGATLQLVKGLNFVYQKDGGVLKVTGSYGMVK